MAEGSDADVAGLIEPSLESLVITLTEALTAHVQMITNVAEAILQLEANNRAQHLEILRTVHESAGTNRVGVRKRPRSDREQPMPDREDRPS